MNIMLPDDSGNIVSSITNNLNANTVNSVNAGAPPVQTPPTSAASNDGATPPPDLQEKINAEIYKQNFELSIRNKTLSTLRALYSIATTSLGISQTAQKIADTIAQELNVASVRISLVDNDNSKLQTLAINQSPQIAQAIAEVNRPLTELAIPLEYKANLAVVALDKKENKISGNLFDVMTPAVSQVEADTIVRVTGVKTVLIYPLIIGGVGAGVLTIGITKGEQDLSRAEHETLEQLVDVVAIAIDRAKLLQDLQGANDRLHELDKLKSEFVSVASHELRTPMTAIKSYLWMALAGRGGLITDKQKYYLERAYISTDRLIKLVNDLLNVSRIESGKLSLDVAKIDLGKFVDEVISEVKPRADEEMVSVVNEYDNNHPLPSVIGDSDKLKEVIINLVGNSLKFTTQGGKIRIWFEVKEGFVVTHVSDNGEGISPDDLPKLFQKFGLVKESYVTNQKASQGTGLGLYISKSIVEMHHGKMWAESEGHGKGATFSFTLPIYSDQLMADFKAQYGSKEGLGIIHSTID